MNLLIIDDDELLVKSLITILTKDPSISVSATGHDGSVALQLYKDHPIDIVLMDIRMKEMYGIEAAIEILNLDPSAKILFLTTFTDHEYIQKSLSIGARGYLIKQDFDSITPALHAVMSGQVVFGSEIIAKLPTWKQFESRTLKDAEIELITRLAQGLSNKELANELFLSEGTIRNYLSVIMEKLNLRDRTQLVIYYYEHLR